MLHITSVQTASTGTGPDRGFYSTFFSYVRTENVSVVPVRLSFPLSALKGELIKKEKTVIVPSIPLHDGAAGNYVAVLNGFDLVSKKSAQKIKHFSLNVSEVYLNKRERMMSCSVHTSLAMDCKSLECARKYDDYEYILNVSLLFISGDVYASSPTKVPTSYTWNRRAEPKPVQKIVSIKGTANNGYTLAVPAIRSISLNLQRPNWFIEWAHYCREEEYNAAEGVMEASVFSSFKSWREGMRRHSFEKKYSRFSLREHGSAELETGIMLLQFKNGCRIAREVDGEIYWRGRGTSADSEEAFDRKTFAFDTELPED